jgi:hypothetical protein
MSDQTPPAPDLAALSTLSDSDEYWLRNLDKAGHSAFSLVVDYLRKAVKEIDALRAIITAAHAAQTQAEKRARLLEDERAARIVAVRRGIPAKATRFIAENPKTAQEHGLSTLLDVAVDTGHRLKQAERHINACESMIREHSEAASIFQPGGRFHRRADLSLGRSAVVDGIAWLVRQLDQAEQRRDEALRSVWKRVELEAAERGGTSPHAPTRQALMEFANWCEAQRAALRATTEVQP